MCIPFQGFTSLLERSSELEADVPLIKSHMATFAAHAVFEEVSMNGWIKHYVYSIISHKNQSFMVVSY